MANFRAYPGLHVIIIKELKSAGDGQTLKVGSVYQLLSIPHGIFGSHYTFVGVCGAYKERHMGQYIEPVYKKETAHV